MQTEEIEMTKPNKDGWIRHRGGKCPVDGETYVCCRLRDGWKLAPKKASEIRWTHANEFSDVMAYRLFSQPKSHEQTQMTAEQIRTDYIENLAAIAALHKEQVALVQQLRELGFAFVDAN